VLSVIALLFVFHKVDVDSVIQRFKVAKIEFIFLAVVFFILSKIISAYRLNHVFKSLSISLTHKINLKIYWRGMFYNIFLPGSVSGDLYKTYYLHRNYNNRIKDILSAIIIDRINGLLVLLLLLLVPVAYFLDGIYEFIIPAGIIFVFTSFLFITRQNFQPVSRKIFLISSYSFFVQFAQLISVSLLLYALNSESSDTIILYLFIFLISSVVSVLPLTIGGMGAREVTFLYLSNFFDYDVSVAVSLSLLFQIITLMVSLAGSMVSLKEQPKQKTVMYIR